jgi:hypothetical protein
VAVRLLAAALLLAACAGGWLAWRAQLAPADLWALAQERSLMDAVRYAERRLQGHPKLEVVALPLLGLLRDQHEREVPAELADLGKGQRLGAQVPVRHDGNGRPVPAAQALQGRNTVLATRVLRSSEEIVSAVARAQAGEVLEIAPGRYRIATKIKTGQPGEPGRPITLRAAQAGSVMLEVVAVEAMVIGHPYWVVENLDWQGRCSRDDDCEHALHVVGAARGTVVVNNRMSDFNAHIKVNAENGRFPDEGLVQFNTLDNTRARQTVNPVTPFDLVAASGWQFMDNRVEHFIRADVRKPSYGVFMKGASEGGRIERNVVVCTRSGISQPGQRVGISLGGGGTGAPYCRDGRCDFEHRGGVVANNVVAHCNDAGVDISKAVASLVLHNTLVNTQGVNLRNPPADAEVLRNVMDSGIHPRRGTQAVQADNLFGPTPGLYANADALQLTWRQLPEALHLRHERAPDDFCGRPRPSASPPGAVAGAARCLSARPTPQPPQGAPETPAGCCWHRRRRSGTAPPVHPPRRAAAAPCRPGGPGACKAGRRPTPALLHARHAPCRAPRGSCAAAPARSCRWPPGGGAGRRR